jgi:hypothetical protein
MEDLTYSQRLWQSCEGTGGGRFGLYVEKWHGVDEHVAGEGISEVIRAGVVVILDLVLLQDLSVLFLCVLRSVTAGLEELQHFGGFHLVYLVS